MASIASSSGAGSLHPRFEIFINHRGPDEKLKFVAHLAQALRDKHYTPFVDKYDMKKGESGSEEIQAALDGASVQLAIFTSGYAGSQYCLDELVDMVERRKKDPEKVKLIPIFLSVEPRDLRRPEEKPFGAAFQEHESKALGQRDEQLRENELKRIERWKRALVEAADRDGLELSAEAGDENELKHKIVARVESILGSRVVRKQQLPRHVVGPESFDHVEGELEKMGDKVAALGIWGMGGIGKTTLAQRLYNRYTDPGYTERYEFHSFVNIGGAKTMEDLQKQVMYDLLGRKDDYVREMYAGWFKELVGRRVLLVIDNISTEDHIYKLIPDMGSLGIGSRVILTSREERVLKSVSGGRDAFYLHEMQVLDYDASHELFSFYAFENKRRPETTDEFHPLAEKIVLSCGGLPLALKIIAKHLIREVKGVWEEAAKSVETRLSVLDVLSISYGGLSESEKMMFLDVSCQMMGMLEDDAMDIWKSCAGCSTWCLTARSVLDSLSTLKGKALVKLDTDKRLTMHDLLQEMGRRLAGREHVHDRPRKLGEHSHLWNAADVEYVLKNHKGTENIRGLLLDWRKDGYHFDASNFEKMTEIHLLQLDSAIIDGDFSKFPETIRWLRWRFSALTKVPSGLRFPNLTHLDLFESGNLTRLWPDGDTQVPRFLRVLNLYNCKNLEEIPENVGYLSMLRRLNLEGCRRLRSLPSSFGCLAGLHVLILKWCSGLERLPESFSELSVLEELDLGGCSSLLELPKSVKGLVKLRVLELHRTALTELPSDIGDLDQLQDLTLDFCENLVSLPESFGRLSCLGLLSLIGCRSLQRLCSNFGELRSLFHLDLCYCSMEEVGFPKSFWSLSYLMFLSVGESRLTRLPEEFINFTRLREFSIFSSHALADIGSLPRFLERLDLRFCPSLKGILNLRNLTWLKSLNLRDCIEVTAVHGLEHMQDLEHINVRGCCSLTEMYSDVLFKPKLKWCFFDGSKACLNYNSKWYEEEPSSQIVSFLPIPFDAKRKGIFGDLDGGVDTSLRRSLTVICKEMTILNEKRVDAVIIIVAVATSYPHSFDIGAKIVRSGVDVYSCVLVTEFADYDAAVGLQRVFILTLRRSHPLVRQLQHGDRLCVSSQGFVGCVGFIYDIERDLDKMRSTLNDLCSSGELSFESLEPIDTGEDDDDVSDPDSDNSGNSDSDTSDDEVSDSDSSDFFSLWDDF